jgi:hypothetical protein
LEVGVSVGVAVNFEKAFLANREHRSSEHKL